MSKEWEELPNGQKFRSVEHEQSSPYQVVELLWPAVDSTDSEEEPNDWTHYKTVYYNGTASSYINGELVHTEVLLQEYDWRGTEEYGEIEFWERYSEEGLDAGQEKASDRTQGKGDCPSP